MVGAAFSKIWTAGILSIAMGAHGLDTVGVVGATAASATTRLTFVPHAARVVI